MTGRVYGWPRSVAYHDAGHWRREATAAEERARRLREEAARAEQEALRLAKMAEIAERKEPEEKP